MAKTADEKMAIYRSDGFVNAITGIGQSLYDKSQAGNFCPDLRRTPIEDEELWRQDDMAAKAVEKPVFEMLRAGFSVTIKAEDEAPDTGEDPADSKRTDAFPPGGGAAPTTPALPPRPKLAPGVDPTVKAIEAVKAQSKSKAISEDLAERHKKLKVRERFTEAMNYHRGIGGGAILMGVDDGQTLDKPVNMEGVKSLKWLNAIHRTWLTPYSLQGDPQEPDFGEINLWRVMAPHIAYSYAQPSSAATKNIASELIVHSSRLLIWQGVRISQRQLLANGGFGDSIFQRIYRPLRDFQQAWQGASILLQDFAQAIVKIKGLAELIGTDQDDAVKTRIQLIDLSRSIAKCVVLDATEDFERKSTSLAGYPEMMDRLAQRYCAAVDMPETIVMGKSPAGKLGGGAGESEDRNWKDRVSAMQSLEVEPQLHQLIEIEFAAKDGPTKGRAPAQWAIKWNPLHRLTDKEMADARFVQAQTDQIYESIQAVTSDDLAVSRFGGPEYSFETQVNFEARAAIQAAQPTPEDVMNAHAAAQANALTGAKPPAPGASQGNVPAPGKKPDPATNGGAT